MNNRKMDKIFTTEHQVLEKAEELLSSRQFDSESDCAQYKELYEEYKSLLRQTTKLVHMADRVQLELKNVSKELEKASQVDMLTGICNRTFFMKVCDSEWKSAQRAGRSLALLMIDVDYFKEYNDTYGHLKGDQCLQAVAKQLSLDAKRPRDTVGRYGGDEFVVLLPETDMAGAAALAENIVRDIDRLNMEHRGSKLHGKVTLSVGVSALQPKKDCVMEVLFQQADLALYAAKNDGRNCYRQYSNIQKKD